MREKARECVKEGERDREERGREIKET